MTYFMAPLSLFCVLFSFNCFRSGHEPSLKFVELEDVAANKVKVNSIENRQVTSLSSDHIDATDIQLVRRRSPPSVSVEGNGRGDSSYSHLGDDVAVSSYDRDMMMKKKIPPRVVNLKTCYSNNICLWALFESNIKISLILIFYYYFY